MIKKRDKEKKEEKKRDKKRKSSQEYTVFERSSKTIKVKREVTVGRKQEAGDGGC